MQRYKCYLSVVVYLSLTSCQSEEERYCLNDKITFVSPSDRVMFCSWNQWNSHGNIFTFANKDVCTANMSFWFLWEKTCYFIDIYIIMLKLPSIMWNPLYCKDNIYCSTYSKYYSILVHHVKHQHTKSIIKTMVWYNILVYFKMVNCLLLKLNVNITFLPRCITYIQYI